MHAGFLMIPNLNMKYDNQRDMINIHLSFRTIEKLIYICWEIMKTCLYPGHVLLSYQFNQYIVFYIYKAGSAYINMNYGVCSKITTYSTIILLNIGKVILGGNVICIT